MTPEMPPDIVALTRRTITCIQGHKSRTQARREVLQILRHHRCHLRSELQELLKRYRNAATWAEKDELMQAIQRNEKALDNLDAVRDWALTLIERKPIQRPPRPPNPSAILGKGKLAEVCALWNNPPYPTLQTIADRYGVTREYIRALLVRAKQDGLDVLPRAEQNRRRAELRHPERYAPKPTCVCGRQLSRSAKPHPDGKYYCGTCRSRCEHCRERNRNYVRRTRNKIARMQAGNMQGGPNDGASAN